MRALRIILGVALAAVDLSPAAWAQPVPGNVPICTTAVAGKCKPDGSTITVDPDGTIHAAGGGGSVSLSAATADLIFTPDPITGTGTIGSTSALNLQSSGNYAVLTDDAAYTVLTGAHTYTLPQAGTTGFTSGWGACFLNIAESGNSTLTTTTSVFAGAGGATSLTLVPGAWACPTSNGTDWDTLSSGVVAVGSPASPTTSLQYNNSGAFGGTSFNFVADQIVATAVTPGTPSIVASDSTSGFAFDAAGLPLLTTPDNSGGTIAATIGGYDANAGSGFGVISQGPALEVSDTLAGQLGVVINPAVGFAGQAFLEIDSFTSSSSFVIYSAGGSRGAPISAGGPGPLALLHFASETGSGSQVGASIEVNFTEGWTPSSNGTDIHFSTIANGSTSLTDRLVIDGSGDINVLNGGLVVGTPTDGSQGAGTVNAEVAYWLNGGGLLKENLGFPGSLILQAKDNLGSNVPSVLIKGSNAPAASGHRGSQTIIEGGDADPASSQTGGGLILRGGLGGGGSTIALDGVTIYGGDAYAGSGNQGGNIYLSPGASDPSGFANTYIVNGDLNVAQAGVFGTPAGGSQGPGSINVETCFVQGVACAAGSVNHVSYQPGLLTAVNATKAAFHKFSKASTVDNIEGSAATFSCVANPTVTVYECGSSATCASPTTIGTVTITAAGTVVDGSISSATITAGDYVAFAMSAGTCASVDLAATVQTHVN